MLLYVVHLLAYWEYGQKAPSLVGLFISNCAATEFMLINRVAFGVG